MTWTTDNRWSPGGSGIAPPDGALVAYSARWIDQGDLRAADIVPDRQGFAYNTEADRARLIDHLQQVHADEMHQWTTPDVTHATAFDVFHIAVRRSGGYVYVDAWLKPVEDFLAEHVKIIIVDVP